MRSHWREGGLLACVVVAIYANSLSGSFHYDDFHSLVWNPHIRDLQSIPAFFADPGLFSADPDKAMFRPLLLVSYGVNYALGGYEVAGYHLFNLLVHLVCVLLIWHIAAPLGRIGALVAGAIFALHPVATEPVNYISSRSESLAVALLLGGFALYRRRDRLGAVLGPLSFAAALMVKSSAIVLPGLLILDAHCRRERRLELQLPYWVVALAYLATIALNRFLGDSLANSPRGLASQLLTQCKAVVFYLKLLLVPIGLNVEPQFAASASVSGAVVASAALLLSALYVVLKGRGSRFYLGWFGLALAPTLIIPLNVLVNEHRLYLPLAGLALGVGAWWERGGRQSLVWPGIVGLVLWGSLVVQRNAEWRDESSLWAAAAVQSPQMPRVHVHLGNALRDRGLRAAAQGAYERALALDPGHRPARTNLANLYYEAAQADSAQRERYGQQAIRQYREVLKLDPTYREALNNLGSAHMILGDLARAEDIWNQAIKHHPHHAEAHFNMGLLQARMGRPIEAVPHYRRALTLGEDAEIYAEMGNAQAKVGRLTEAAIAYRRAIALSPGDMASRYNLAEVLLVSGETDLAQGRDGLAKWREAQRELGTVLRRDPGHVRAQRRMSQLEERLR